MPTNHRFRCAEYTKPKSLHADVGQPAKLARKSSIGVLPLTPSDSVIDRNHRLRIYRDSILHIAAADDTAKTTSTKDAGSGIAAVSTVMLLPPAAAVNCIRQTT